MQITNKSMTYSGIWYATKILKQSWMPFITVTRNLRRSLLWFWVSSLNPDDARHASRFAFVVGMVTLHTTLSKVSGPAKTYGLITNVWFDQIKLILPLVICWMGRNRLLFYPSIFKETINKLGIFCDNQLAKLIYFFMNLFKPKQAFEVLNIINLIVSTTMRDTPTCWKYQRFPPSKQIARMENCLKVTLFCLPLFFARNTYMNIFLSFLSDNHSSRCSEEVSHFLGEGLSGGRERI